MTVIIVTLIIVTIILVSDSSDSDSNNSDSNNSDNNYIDFSDLLILASSRPFLVNKKQNYEIFLRDIGMAHIFGSLLSCS